jgi:hypothetical protein
VADRLALGQPSDGACARQTRHLGNQAAGDVDTTNSTVVASGRRERGATNAACGQPWEASVDATARFCGAPQERVPSRRQTHRVGNQAVRASRGKLDAWRNQAERASWDGRGGSSNRSPVLVETDLVRGQLWIESVVRTKFIVVYRHDEGRRRDTCGGSGNRDAGRSGGKLGSRGQPRERRRSPELDHRKATGGDSGSRARRFGKKARNLEQALAARRRKAGFFRERRCGRGRRAIAKAKAWRRNVVSGGRG